MSDVVEDQAAVEQNNVKASTIMSESNRLYHKISEHNNVNVPMADALIQKLGIDPANPSVAGLTLKHKGTLLKSICGFLAILGQELEEDTLEENLQAAGYNDVQQAMQDIPAFFAGGPLRIIGGNLHAGAQIVGLMAQLVDDASLTALLMKLVSIRNALATAAPTMDEV
jgi:hypothetical protein